MTNLAAAGDVTLAHVKLSANWMAPPATPARTRRCSTPCARSRSSSAPRWASRFRSARTRCRCRRAGATARREHAVTSPVSLVVSAFVHVPDVRHALTPQLRLDRGPTRLLWIDLVRRAAAAGRVGAGAGLRPARRRRARRRRSGAAGGVHGGRAPTRARPHADRVPRPLGDGGLFATLAEMAFAARCGLEVELPARCRAAAPRCSPRSSAPSSRSTTADAARVAAAFARPAPRCTISARRSRASGSASGSAARPFSTRRASICIAPGRPPPTHCSACATTPTAPTRNTTRIDDRADPGLTPRLTFDPDDDVAAPFVATGARPRVAILREQGVNGQVEMAAAFTRAGFDAFDVHMSDLIAGRRIAGRLRGFVACGGFSYGDVLGRRRRLGQVDPVQCPRPRRIRGVLRARRHVRARGVQRLPDDEQPAPSSFPVPRLWPHFVRNHSEQFEARLTLLEVQRARRACSLPAWPAAAFRSRSRTARVYAEFATPRTLAAVAPLVALRFVDDQRRADRALPATIRTGRRRASPGSRRPTVASPS